MRPRVAGLLALDTAADCVDSGEAEPDGVEGIQHSHRVAEHSAQGGDVAAIGSSAATPMPARQAGWRSVTQLTRAAADRPATTSSSRAGPCPWVRSTMPVAKLVERVASESAGIQRTAHRMRVGSLIPTGRRLSVPAAAPGGQSVTGCPRDSVTARCQHVLLDRCCTGETGTRLVCQAAIRVKCSSRTRRT